MRFARSLVQLYASKGTVILVAAVILTAGALMAALNLSLEADLERLLPETAPSVKGTEKLKKAYGPIGRLTLVLEGDDEAKLKAATRDLGEKLKERPKVKRTEYRRPVGFFTDNRLLYVELEDLKTASERITKRIKFEKKRANPLFVDVSGKKAPSVDLSDIEEKYDSLGQDEYFKSKDNRKYLVFVYFTFPPGDLSQSAAEIDEIRTWATEELKAYDGVSLEFTGRYKKRVDQTRMLEQDLATATVVALLLLILFLLVYFRSIKIPVLIVGPLLMGTLWAFAWAQLVFGTLNILTGFLGAVILGLGIDYGIHIMSRFLEARGEGDEPQEALAVTLNSAGRASIYAGITTVVAFGSLAISHFRAFHEYGIIALGGMSLIILANVVVLPVLLLKVQGTFLEPKSKKIDVDINVNGALRPTLLGIITVMAVVAGLFIGNTAFEYDFQKVFSTDLPSWTLDLEVDEILELPQIPAVVLAENPEHAAKIRTEIERRMEALPEGKTVKSVMTVEDLLPPSQDEKLQILQDLNEEFEKLPSRVMKDQKELREFNDEISAVLETGGVQRAKLPESLAKPFSRIDDPKSSVVLIFPAIELNDAREMAEFAIVIRELPTGANETRNDAVSEALIMVDIIDFVRSDSTFMLSITLIGLLLCAIIAFRRPRRVSVLVGTIATAIFIALGMTALFDVQFNFINVLILPIWLGLGVDAAFHLMVRIEESPDDVAGFIGTASAVFAAFATSMIGFGAMLVTNHNGLSSLGWAAVVGLGSILVASLIIQAILFLGAQPKS